MHCSNVIIVIRLECVCLKCNEEVSNKTGRGKNSVIRLDDQMHLKEQSLVAWLGSAQRGKRF